MIEDEYRKLSTRVLREFTKGRTQREMAGSVTVTSICFHVGCRDGICGVYVGHDSDIIAKFPLNTLNEVGEHMVQKRMEDENDRRRR